MIERYLNSVWAIEETLHSRLFAIGIARINKGQEAFTIKNKADVSRATKPYSGKVAGMNVSGNVRILSIDGVMSRNGDLCSAGTEQLSAWIDEANADPAIAGILLKLNSGGGDVDGTEALGNYIKSSTKPIVAFVAGTAASAAYWVASQATEIIMESATTAQVGSIGVLCSYVNVAENLAKDGYKVEIIRSDGSEDKAPFNGIEPLTDAARADTKTQLNTIKGTFVNTVKTARPKVADTVFTGKMYNGQDAIKLGLADRVGSLNDALGRVLVLAKKAQNNQGSNNQNSKSNNTKMSEKVMSVFGGEIPENITEEQVLLINTALESQAAAHRTALAEANEAHKATGSQYAAQAIELEMTTKQLAEANATLDAYTETKLSAPQVAVLAKWYANENNGQAPAADAAGIDTQKTYSGSTQMAIDLRAKMGSVSQKK